ncbi:TCP-1/cpn60 chaperonin family protein [Cupriavidus sp. WKF15]|uniref:TCP-1/cpn60 chaperonin family protein n=1 Tax=Cupriavidus sp. WKF15 TaxID=3032282 RepID=UPI0023E2079B|nr:TCP-1/cpn60 chaperonin family protein [Cupriavidus sp. WKF15]WER50631.1 TCP-1/cpn60 chaperonin family protein [Cupriavidus sp. WKF15]
MALIRARTALQAWQAPNPEPAAGARIVHAALAAPMRQIVANAGADADGVVHRVCEGSGTLGYDAGGERYGGMLELGVIDPVKVVRTALQNAISIASLLLTTDCMIALERAPYPSAEGAARGAGMFGEEY